MADDELDQKPNKLFSRAWVIALSATFVLVLGGVVAVFVNPKLYAIVTRSKATHEEQIACAVREVTKLNMNDRLRITSTASSASTLLPPTVSGYLQSSASLAGLVTALKQQCPQVLVRVYADEELSGLINARLTSQAPNWRIESIRQGRVVLRRTKSEGAAFTLAQNDIKKNVPGLAAVEESQIDAQIKQEVARLLSEASLTTKLNAELREERLDVSGSPSLEEVRRWEEVRAQLQQKFGSQLVLAVKFDRPRNGGLPFDVHQVVAGTMPFVVLTDGTRLFEGGTRDGYTLVSIKGRRLQFVGITQSQPPVELQW